LDILACPIDKAWPLQVHIFDTTTNDKVTMPAAEPTTGVICKYYCARKKVKLIDEEQSSNDKIVITKGSESIDYNTDCKLCLEEEITAGMIQCPKCNNFFPIIEDIPMMLKPELRNEDIEREFTNKWADKLKELFKPST
jgi:uncharacterized protein YbaR (Trm112 family)